MTSFDHNGHTVTLTERFEFEVAGPQWREPSDKYQKMFGSAIEAKSEIDRRVAQATKQAEAIRRVALSALDAEGKEITIRGINRTDSTILGGSGAKGFRKMDAFPNFPWIADLLKKRVAFCNEINKIETTLYGYGFSGSRAYGRLDGDYDAHLSKLEHDYSEKSDKARAVAEQRRAS